MNRLLILLFLAFNLTLATVINIPADQPTIQIGIDSSVNGDTVFVASGTYIENINFNGKSIALIGEDSELTIIDGNGIDTVVKIISGEDSTTVLSGFTITNGHSWPGWAGNGPNYNGGGIDINESNPTLKNLIISNNFANSPEWESPGYGGGISISYSDNVYIQNVVVKNNKTDGTFSGGGGIAIWGSTLLIENSIIEDNIGDHFLGGGIFSENSSDVTIINSTIRNNQSGAGGGIYHNSGSLLLSNVLIENNSANNNGGGLSVSGGNIELDEVIITHNFAQNGGGIKISNGTLSIKNSSIHTNYSDIGGGIYLGQGNTVFDPIERSSIYLNSANEGRDLYVNESFFVDVVLDTFTVLNPNEIFATPINNYSFDILNIPFTSIPSDIYVSVNGDDNNSGLTVNDPFQTINKALTVIESDSLNPRNIFISDGIYSPSTNGENYPIYLKSNVSLIGNSVESTILDGELSTNGIIFGYFQSGISLMNLTLENASSDFGGGINAISTALYLENIKIQNCSATRGGGLSLTYESPSNAYNLQIINCHASDKGGGIFNSSTSVFENGILSGNTALSYGGGIYSDHAQINNFQIINNTAHSGGGIYAYGNITLQNCNIENNVADIQGGGLFSNSWSQTILSNTDIKYNSAGSSGGGILFKGNNVEFDLESLCSIFGNYAHDGMDFKANFSSSNQIVVNVDTFSTTIPTTDFYAKPQYLFQINTNHELIELQNSDFYISSNGNDDNSGLTFEEPLLTVRNALSKIYSDTLNPRTIFLNNGIYDATTTGEMFPITPFDYITISGISANETIIDAQETSNVFFIENSIGVDINNLTIKGGNSGYGGGIFCRNTNPQLTNLIIKQNHAVNKGGGIYLDKSDPIITFTEISNNSANLGGGISTYSYSEPTIDHTTIVNNTAGQGGNGIYLQYSYYLEMTNSILWNSGNEILGGSDGSQINITYSNIYDGWDGEGNINENPLFTDSENGDFTLQENSPCINTGNPNSLLDPDGTISDMGAYYLFQSSGFLGDLNDDGLINISDVLITVEVILNNEFNQLADLNVDGIIDVIDILLIVNIILGN